jgi:hypothetical protein
MSDNKARSKKYAKAVGDARETAEQSSKRRNSVITKGTEIPTLLKKLQVQLGPIHGAVVKEMDMEVKELQDLDLWAAPDDPNDETEEEKDSRREDNRIIRRMNMENIQKRKLIIQELQNNLPDFAVKWLERHHAEVISQGQLNQFCILISKALASNSPKSSMELRAEFEEERAKHRSWKLKSLEHLDGAIKTTMNLKAFYGVHGITYTDEEMVFDLSEKLAGQLSEYKLKLQRTTEERERALKRCTTAAQRNQVELSFDPTPVTVEQFELEARSFKYSKDTNEIRNYATTFATVFDAMDELRAAARSQGVVLTTRLTRPAAMPSKRNSATVVQKAWMKDKTCDLCDEVGHVVKVCPFKGEALKAAKSAKGTTSG